MFSRSPVRAALNEEAGGATVAGLSLLERTLVFYGTRLPNHPRKWWVHHRLREWLGVAIDRDIEVERQGLRWSLNPADHGHNALFWMGTKDTWDIHHLRRLLRTDDVVLDVGANYGYYAVTLAAALRRRCRIHALEPDPANLARLRRHVAGNDLDAVVRTHGLGVSDRDETVCMSEPAENSGHAAVVPTGEIQGVTLTTIDAFCDARAIDRLDVLIVDVEGYEERALKGAAQTLARSRPLVFVELFPPVMDRQGSSPEATARILTDQGYRLFAARRDRLEPLTTMPTGEVGVNAFGLHPDNPRFAPWASRP
jgi:FkbM family methyltransferase